MTIEAAMAQADLLARAGAGALLLLLAAVTMRDQGARVVGRLGAAFALGSAAFVVCTAAGFHAHPAIWAAPILALASGDNLVFWLFARALFDDVFRLRRWHGAAWLGIVALDMVLAYGLEPAGSPLAPWVHGALSLCALGFALLAVGQTLTTWGADLVEPRRRIRPFVVGAAALFITLTALANLAQASGAPTPGLSLAQAFGLLAIVAVAAWSLLSAEDGQGLFAGPARAQAGEERIVRPQGPDGADAALVSALEQLMRVERMHRQDGLTIAELARRLGLPEYRLRRLINQALGHRNFNSFLNGYRLDEAKAALADPGQAEVPILTIALDAGFGSLGPFNRAFKAETGVTPTEFRRRAADVVSRPASRISKSA
jgi:AraC-like DNA-binding protein